MRDIIQILFIVLVIGGPLFIAIAKKMKEAKIKRERDSLDKPPSLRDGPSEF